MKKNYVKLSLLTPVEPDVPSEPEDFVTMGMPQPPLEIEHLMGDIIEGEERAIPSYEFATTILKELLATTN